MTDKEEYAKQLARRAERGLLALKILVISAAVAVFGLVIFSIICSAANAGDEAKLIGFAVFIALCLAFAIGAVTAFIVAKLSINKLKKLG